MSPENVLHKNGAGFKAIAISLVLFTLFLCGCMQTEERLIVRKDGSGTLEVIMLVPPATAAFLDAMIQQASQAAGRQKDVPLPQVKDIVGNKDEIIKKARQANLNIEFITFSKNTENDGSLRVNYNFKYDDINKLIKSGLLSFNVDVAKDQNGRLVCFLKQDEEKADSMKEKIEELKKGTGPEGSEEKRKQLAEVLKGFRAKFIVTLPNSIDSVGGMFKKIDDNSAQIEFIGDLLDNPVVIEEMFGLRGGMSEVSCSAEGLSFEARETVIDSSAGIGTAGSDINKSVEEPHVVIFENEEAEPQEIRQSQEDSSSKEPIVKIIFKDGRVTEGRLLEENAESLSVDCAGIPITYYKDEIDSVERI